MIRVRILMLRTAEGIIASARVHLPVLRTLTLSSTDRQSVAGSLDARQIVWLKPLCQGPEKAGVAGREVPEVRVLSLPCLFSLYTMADFSPPPLFFATSTESEAADFGGLFMTHGKVLRPAVGPL